MSSVGKRLADAQVRALDKQEGGSHYKDMPIQPVEFIVANSIPYREANVIKYVARHATKNGVQDINKAIHYLEMIRDDYGVETQIESDNPQIGEKSESSLYKSESSSSDKNTTVEPAKNAQDMTGKPAISPEKPAKEPDSSAEWIEWYGGVCPVPDRTRTFLKFSDGEELVTDCPQGYEWGHYGADCDIIAYKVIK